MQSLRGIFPRPPKGPPKRDFIKENVNNIKLVQQHYQQPNVNPSKEMNELVTSKPERFKTRSTSHSRLCSSTNLIKDRVTAKSKENVRKSARPVSVQSRDAYSQTESVDDELFLKDVIIRLPSASISNDNNKKYTNEDVVEVVNLIDHGTNDDRNDQDHLDGVAATITNEPYIQRNSPTNDVQEFHTEIGIDRPIHQFSSRCEHSLQLCAKDNSKPVVPTTYRKGELPKYLKEMKNKEVERNRLLSLVDLNCPPGHTLLSEAERLESLQITQKKYQDLIDELNHMPLTSQTLRVRNRQIEIEKELRKLDVTIQIFSRSRVYVKNEE